MKTLGRLAFVAAAVALFGSPAELSAQGRGESRGQGRDRDRRYERREELRGELREREDEGRRMRVGDRRSRAGGRWSVDDDLVVLRDGRGRIIVMDRDDFENRFRIQRRGQGPSFCRNGQGHPVHGRRWCLHKGFGLGVRRDVFDERGRPIFRQGDQVLVVRHRERDRGTIDRIVEKILLGGD